MFIKHAVSIHFSKNGSREYNCGDWRQCFALRIMDVEFDTVNRKLQELLKLRVREYTSRKLSQVFSLQPGDGDVDGAADVSSVNRVQARARPTTRRGKVPCASSPSAWLDTLPSHLVVWE